MHKTFTTLKYSFWTVLLVILTACGTIAPPATPIVTPIASSTSILTLTPALPTANLAPTPVLSPIPTPLPKFSLDNLRMAYIVDGNLHLQDGSNPPIQLTNSNADIYPVFSDDGKKIVFYRGKISDNSNVFSINADGSHEQALITPSWLNALGMGTKAGHLVFVPSTHQILFNTYLCPGDLSSDCTAGLFLANTDTGEVKEIMHPDLGGDLLSYANFSVSPDGQLMSVAHAGQIDILGMEGKIIHRSIMKYTRSAPIELYPRVFWLSDSSGLIVALFDEVDFKGPVYSGYPAYTIWRYTFKDNLATQIPLNPPPTWVSMDCKDVMSVSPNGKWVVYHTNDLQVYEGNLVDGSVNLYLPYAYCLPAYWSSDNVHFVDSGNPERPMLGTVDKPPVSIPGFFLGWIDAKRYIYFSNPSFPIKEDIQIHVGEISGEVPLIYQSNISIPPISPYSFTFIILGGN